MTDWLDLLPAPLRDLRPGSPRTALLLAPTGLALVLAALAGAPGQLAGIGAGVLAAAVALVLPLPVHDRRFDR